MTTHLLIWLWNGIKYCHGCMVSRLLLSQQACWRILFIILKRKKRRDLVKSCLHCKTLPVHVQETNWSRQAPNTFMERNRYKGERKWWRDEDTHLFLLIGSNGRDVSHKAAVAPTVDVLVKEAGGVEAHSLLSLLHQGGLLALDLEDLSLDVCTEQNTPVWHTWTPTPSRFTTKSRNRRHPNKTSAFQNTTETTSAGLRLTDGSSTRGPGAELHPAPLRTGLGPEPLPRPGHQGPGADSRAIDVRAGTRVLQRREKNVFNAGGWGG